MFHVHDAGVLAYRPAWDLQLQLHERVLTGAAGPHPGGVLMLVEHPAVITIGRRPGADRHILAPAKLLAARGVEVVETDRGGDITFHGPGQLVAYPILPLNTYHLNLHSYLRLLEQAVIDTLATFRIAAVRDPSPTPATGVWVRLSPESSVLSPESPTRSPHDAELRTQNSELRTQDLGKIAAIGIKVRRWITLHGVALNVSTDLSFFDLINPCGLSRPVTSMQKLLGPPPFATPPMPAVKQTLVTTFQRLLAR